MSKQNVHLKWLPAYGIGFVLAALAPLISALSIDDVVTVRTVAGQVQVQSTKKQYPQRETFESKLVGDDGVTYACPGSRCISKMNPHSGEARAVGHINALGQLIRLEFEDPNVRYHYDLAELRHSELLVAVGLASVGMVCIAYFFFRRNSHSERTVSA